MAQLRGQASGAATDYSALFGADEDASAEPPVAEADSGGGPGGAPDGEYAELFGEGGGQGGAPDGEYAELFG